MPAAPFDRVENGYDPRQVAAFAAEALGWKRELGEARAELARYSKIIGEIDDVEREAAQILDHARIEAEKIIERAHERVAIPASAFTHIPRSGTESDAPVGPDQPVDDTSTACPEPDDLVSEPEDASSDADDEAAGEDDAREMTREERIEAARAQLFRRRGTILPQE